MNQCPQCQGTVQPGDQFCQHCAFPFSSDQPPNPSSQPPYQLPPAVGSRTTLRWLTRGVLLCFAIIALFFLIWFSIRWTHPSELAVVAVPPEHAPPTLSPTPTASVETTPTPKLHTPPGTVLYPGQSWYRNGVTLELASWDGDQVLTFVLHNETDEVLHLDRLHPRLLGISPERDSSAEQIVVHDPELDGAIQPGASKAFQVAVTIQRERRSEWPRVILLVEQFGPIKNAQWELEIVNTPTPTATATSTATATATPLPTDTPTPVPTTVPGTVLEPNQTWYEGGLALWLDVKSVDHNKLRIDLILENHSARTITGYSSYQNYRLVTNLGQVINPAHFSNVDKFKPEAYFSLYGNFEIHPGERVVIASNGVFELDLTDPAITEVTIEVVELSRITIARWKIPIPH